MWIYLISFLRNFNYLNSFKTGWYKSTNIFAFVFIILIAFLLHIEVLINVLCVKKTRILFILFYPWSRLRDCIKTFCKTPAYRFSFASVTGTGWHMPINLHTFENLYKWPITSGEFRTSSSKKKFQGSWLGSNSALSNWLKSKLLPNQLISVQ